MDDAFCVEGTMLSTVRDGPANGCVRLGCFMVVPELYEYLTRDEFEFAIHLWIFIMRQAMVKIFFKIGWKTVRKRLIIPAMLNFFYDPESRV